MPRMPGIRWRATKNTATRVQRDDGRLGLSRMFLHAHSVSFTWPDTGCEFTASVPLAAELAAVLDRM